MGDSAISVVIPNGVYGEGKQFGGAGWPYNEMTRITRKGSGVTCLRGGTSTKAIVGPSSKLKRLLFPPLLVVLPSCPLPGSCFPQGLSFLSLSKFSDKR